MFVRLEVACESDMWCRYVYVRIDDIAQFQAWEDEKDASVKSLVILNNGEEFLCVTDISYYHRLLSTNNMLLSEKIVEE